MSLVTSLGSTGLVVAGTIVGSVTLNPIILDSISGSGVLLGVYNKIKNFDRKVEMSKFACTSYDKTLNTPFRSCLRGNEWNEQQTLES